MAELQAELRQHARAGQWQAVLDVACSPPFAHRALGTDRSIGLLLPCNVVVRTAGDGTVVEALDPQVMVTLTGRPELKPVADEVGRRLASALAELTR